MDSEIKKCTFEFYTCELTPMTTNVLFLPTELQDDFNVTTIEELKQKKNMIFSNAIQSPLFHLRHRRKQLHHKVLYGDENYIVLKIANSKFIKAEVDFKKVQYPHEPSILIVIDNRPDKQQIAIEKNIAVFSTTETIVNSFKKAVERILLKYYLVADINNRFRPSDFWEMIREHPQITELKIELTRENLADIYQTLSKQIADYGDLTNSQRVILTQQAPKESILENLDRNNATLVDIVDAASKGTGPISLKVVGSKKQISTKNSRITNQVDIDVTAEGLTGEQAENLADKIFKVLNNGD
jgi:hypothetical protein